MKVRTDFHSVNLSTGEKTRSVVGDGKRIDERITITKDDVVMSEHMTKAQIKEHNIEISMLKCRHFNGVQNKVCKAGVNYDDVVPIPCIGVRLGQTRPVANCEKQSCWTREEAIENEKEREQRTARFMLGLHAAHEAAKSLGLKKGKGGNGSVECPVCHGTLRFSVASYNGHLWGRCDTQDCLSWMQ